MRLLLDTHVFLWWVKNDLSLGPKARQSIGKAEEIYVSLASAWEFSIKKALGKMDLGVDFEEAIDGEQFNKLPVTFEHARAIGDMKPHHRDPFDHMLVVQAMAEGLVLITGDKKLFQYPAKFLDAKS